MYFRGAQLRAADEFRSTSRPVSRAVKPVCEQATRRA
jgi:hypothetical protein